MKLCFFFDTRKNGAGEDDSHEEFTHSPHSFACWHSGCVFWTGTMIVSPASNWIFRTHISFPLSPCFADPTDLRAPPGHHVCTIRQRFPWHTMVSLNFVCSPVFREPEWQEKGGNWGRHEEGRGRDWRGTCKRRFSCCRYQRTASGIISICLHAWSARPYELRRISEAKEDSYHAPLCRRSGKHLSSGSAPTVVLLAPSSQWR